MRWPMGGVSSHAIINWKPESEAVQDDNVGTSIWARASGTSSGTSTVRKSVPRVCWWRRMRCHFGILSLSRGQEDTTATADGGPGPGRKCSCRTAAATDQKYMRGFQVFSCLPIEGSFLVGGLIL